MTTTQWGRKEYHRSPAARSHLQLRRGLSCARFHRRLPLPLYDRCHDAARTLVYPSLRSDGRSRYAGLLRAVEHLSRGEVAEGVALLELQGRVTEIADPQKRIAAIARSYAAHPDNTIVVSPDNASRREINQAVRAELQALGVVRPEDHAFRVLAPRSDMTGADRAWAARYDVGDVLRYQRGSKVLGIENRATHRWSP